jgi:hypothetical protein
MNENDKLLFRDAVLVTLILYLGYLLALSILKL